MRRLHLREYSALEGVTLTSEEASALAASGVVTVTPSWGGGWDLRASSTVGIAQVGEVEVRVHPKVAVRRLLFLLAYAADPTGWRQDEASLGSATDLVEVVGYVFATHAERAVRRGVLQGYVTREDALPTLRGRLREVDQLRTRFGLAVPVEVRYDDYTTDIAENRLLAGAFWLLLRLGAPHALRRRLQHLGSLLGEITAVRPGMDLPAVRFTRLNARYRPAVRLASLILRGGSTRFAVGDVTATTLSFNMNTVFEDFLGAALGRSLEDRGGRVALQHTSTLDEAGRISLRPDLTWWHGATCVAVIDAKYKALQLKGLPNPDVYQMLAYCQAYGLREGHLVYAAGNERATVHTIRRSGVTIMVHALDLDRSPGELLAAVDELATRLTNARSAT